MKSIQKPINEQIVRAAVNALLTKKEVTSRFQRGEHLRKIAKEKGLAVVLPL